MSHKEDISMEWKQKNFVGCLVSVSFERLKQVQANSYLQEGKYPVVDQGQNLIAGWTNDDSKIIKENLPLIIFGDHTRIFKYIDFPFAIGADGTKLIKPNEEELCPRFFYYYLLTLNLPSRGYNRHYRLLKEEIIRYPSLSEQQKIAAILFKIQQAIEVQESIIARLQELKKSTMQYVFMYGLRGEKTKETEIGRIPESWEVLALGDIADVFAGGTPSRDNPAYWLNGSIPWVKTGEINYRVITSTEEYITPLGLRNSSAKLFDSGTLLLAMYGQGVTRGKVGLLGIAAATNQACAAIIPKTEKICSRFLYYYMASAYERLRSLGHGAQQANLNAKIVAGFNVAIPSRDEQENLLRIFECMDVKADFHESKKSALQDLFKTMLYKLMIGEIRVRNLEVDVTELQ